MPTRVEYFEKYLPIGVPLKTASGRITVLDVIQVGQELRWRYTVTEEA
jgi:hypothetical protein